MYTIQLRDGINYNKLLKLIKTEQSCSPNSQGTVILVKHNLFDLFEIS